MGREELIEVIESALVEPIGSQIPGVVWTATPAAKAALSAIEGAGMAVVPREPTEAQIMAALDRGLRYGDGIYHSIYAAMIDAYSPQTRGEG